MEKLLGWIETEDLYNTIEDLKIIFFEPQIWGLNRSAWWWSSICACQEFNFCVVIKICAKTSDYCWITYLTVNSRPFETMLSRTYLNKSKKLCERNLWVKSKWFERNVSKIQEIGDTSCCCKRKISFFNICCSN